MIFEKLFADQIKIAETVENSTRSNTILFPIHGEIAKIVEANSSYKAISLPQKEYEYDGPIGTKKVDIAILSNNKLVGAIMFKGIRSEYNKNANNYKENMLGESLNFTMNNIPIYQVIFIPTKVRHKNSKREYVFETPTKKSYINYTNIVDLCPLSDLLKLGVYYFDVDYNTYTAKYSSKKVNGVEDTLTQGIINFCKEIDKCQTK